MWFWKPNRTPSSCRRCKTWCLLRSWSRLWRSSRSWRASRSLALLQRGSDSYLALTSLKRQLKQYLRPSNRCKLSSRSHLSKTRLRSYSFFKQEFKACRHSSVNSSSLCFQRSFKEISKTKARWLRTSSRLQKFRGWKVTSWHTKTDVQMLKSKLLKPKKRKALLLRKWIKSTKKQKRPSRLWRPNRKKLLLKSRK